MFNKTAKWGAELGHWACQQGVNAYRYATDFI